MCPHYMEAFIITLVLTPNFLLPDYQIEFQLLIYQGQIFSCRYGHIINQGYAQVLEEMFLSSYDSSTKIQFSS